MTKNITPNTHHYEPYIYINANPSNFTERNDQCGNQQHSRELLMMGIVEPETYWAYKKYNKITYGIYLFFYSSVITMMHDPINIRFMQRRLARTGDLMDSIHAVFLEKETGLFHPLHKKKSGNREA